MTPHSGRASVWQDIRLALVGGSRDYTTGSIGRAIFVLAVPMVLEMAMQSVFSVVDVYFVGKLGSSAVAVVGITDSLLSLVFALSLGVGMGATAMIARRIGEKDPERAAVSAVQAIGIGILMSLVVGVAGAIYSDRILGMMGATASMVRESGIFTKWMLAGNGTIVLLFLINAIFRGAGDPARAMRALWIANGLNILLDPLLIFGLGPIPAFGIEGAAIATNLARGIGILYQLRALFATDAILRIELRHLKIQPVIMARLIRVSASGVLQFLIATSAFVWLFRFMARFGDEALAGYTIAVRIIMFVLLPAWGMGNAAATLVGQNLGAGQPERAERSVWMTARWNMGFLLVVAGLLLLFSPQAVSPFSSDPDVIRVAVSCLRIFSLSYVFWGFGVIAVLAFNGAGDTVTPTWINFFSLWVFQLTLAWYLSYHTPLAENGIFIAGSLGQVVYALIGVLWFRRGTWKTRQI